jgi:hypothetical protein
MIDRTRRILIRHFAVAVVALGFAASLDAQTPATPSTQAPAATSAQAPAAPSAQPQEWKTYSYPEDGFSASYASKPEVQKKDVPTAVGTFE